MAWTNPYGLGMLDPYAAAAPAAMAAPAPGGIGGFFRNNQAGLGAIGAGLMSGKWGNYPGLPQAMAVDQARVATRDKERQEKEKENQTIAWLQSQGMFTPEMAEFLRIHPEQAPAFAAELFKQQIAAPEQTSLYKNLVAAGLQPGTPEFNDAMLKGSMPASVNVDLSPKLPTGFMPKDPNDVTQGVVPIPGGPAEQVPAELAARLGMAKEFLRQLPEIKPDIAAGKATGPIDYAAGQQGFGRAGEIHRRLKSGTDALRRMLTGAGMPVAEAEDYVRRYEPTWKDGPEILTDKVNQLELELKSIIREATKGRGEAAGDTSSPPAAPDGAVKNAEDYF